MKTSETEKLILEMLSCQNTPIASADLMKKLNLDCSERTVRRWLAKLVSTGVVIKSGEKRSSKYLLNSRFINREKPETSYHSQASDATLKKVRLPLYERNPVSYETNWLEKYQPNQSHFMPHTLRTRLQQIGKRQEDEEPAGTFAHKIYHRLLIDLSYNSSRLEGNTYSLLETEKLLFEGSTPEGKLEEEKIMILNHKEAIRYLVENAHRLSVNEQTICTLHYLLSDGLVESRYGGKLRDHPVRIGGSTYIPLEGKKQLEAQFAKIISKAAVIEDPFEQSFFLLIQLSYLQGFTDVNKRLARLAANIPLIRKNFVPLSFNDIQRDDYISALIAVYELNEVQPMLDIYEFTYERTCGLYDATIKALGYDEVRVRYRQQRRNILRHIILNKLKDRSMLDYIQMQTNEWIPPESRELFKEDVLEDIQELSPPRIAGLGITLEDLMEYTKPN